MRHPKIAMFAVIAALGAAPAVLASNAPKTPTQAELQKEAKISMEKARSIALKKVRRGGADGAGGAGTATAGTATSIAVVSAGGDDGRTAAGLGISTGSDRRGARRSGPAPGARRAASPRARLVQHHLQLAPAAQQP